MKRSDGIHRAVRALAASAGALARNSRADEGAVPFWFSGQYASLAAVSNWFGEARLVQFMFPK